LKCSNFFVQQWTNTEDYGFSVFFMGLNTYKL
jgi:hypothetical protein